MLGDTLAALRVLMAFDLQLHFLGFKVLVTKYTKCVFNSAPE